MMETIESIIWAKWSCNILIVAISPIGINSELWRIYIYILLEKSIVKGLGIGCCCGWEEKVNWDKSGVDDQLGAKYNWSKAARLPAIESLISGSIP